jgi:hypothetical protein
MCVDGSREIAPHAPLHISATPLLTLTYFFFVVACVCTGGRVSLQLVATPIALICCVI